MKSGSVTVAAGEPQFYAQLLQQLGLDDELLRNQSDPATWPDAKARLAAVFKTKTRDDWNAIMEHTDVCYAPVLSLDEAHQHPHNVERGTFKTINGVVQPGPAPRYSRTPAEIQGPAAHAGQHTDDVLASFGFDASEITKLREAGAVK